MLSDHGRLPYVPILGALEGDVVERAMTAIGEKASNKRVPIYIDNSSSQLSLVKGWSKTERLTEVIKHLYALSVKYNCVIVPIWISTHDNVGADALPRGDLGQFHEWAKDHMCNPPHQHRHSGATASMGASI